MSTMSDETWQEIIICSIPPTTRWLPIIPSLYILTLSADIVSQLLAHGMILDRGNETRPTSYSSNTVLAARTIDTCTNPNCKAKKRTTHTMANCYWLGGGKKGQFPLNFGQRSKANIASIPQDTTKHFVLSTRAYTQDDNNIPTILIEDKDDLIIDTTSVVTEDEEGIIVNVDAPPKAFLSKTLCGGCEDAGHPSCFDNPFTVDQRGAGLE